MLVSPTDLFNSRGGAEGLSVPVGKLLFDNQLAGARWLWSRNWRKVREKTSRCVLKKLKEARDGVSYVGSEKGMKVNSNTREEILLSQNPGECLLSPGQWDRVASVLQLSNRELQVAREVFLGRTRTEIAAELDIQPRTVRHYLEQIHQKLNVRNRVGLVLRIMQVRDMSLGRNGDVDSNV